MSNPQSIVSIQNSQFWYNNGAISLALETISNPDVIIEIKGCSFMFNSAEIGGAIFVHDDFTLCKAYVEIDSNYFFGNAATYGGFYILMVEIIYRCNCSWYNVLCFN